VLNRIAAKMILPRLRLIVARGDTTQKYLEKLKLTNVVRGFDVAFSLKTDAEDMNSVTKFLPSSKGRIIGISPSEVVHKLCQERHIAYLETLKQCVEAWVATGVDCVIFPHSARQGSSKTHNNDLPLLRLLADILPKSPHVHVITEELSAGQLRMLISKFDLLIASRFHAIISGLATGVPVVVIGWSHKYAEALAPFELDAFVIAYWDLSSYAVQKRVEKIEESRPGLVARIQRVSAEIVRDNVKFFDRLVE
jgi:polysaccharide pyruvyl transferase WcaK-like protein